MIRRPLCNSDLPAWDRARRRKNLSSFGRFMDTVLAQRALVNERDRLPDCCIMPMRWVEVRETLQELLSSYPQSVYPDRRLDEVLGCYVAELDELYAYVHGRWRRMRFADGTSLRPGDSRLVLTGVSHGELDADG